MNDFIVGFLTTLGFIVIGAILVSLFLLFLSGLMASFTHNFFLGIGYLIITFCCIGGLFNWLENN